MKKAVISFKMSKRSRSERSFMAGLCSTLANKVVYVPVLGMKADHLSAVTKVKVVRLTDGEQSFVPVFSSEENFNDWRQSQKQSCDLLGLYGSDLCVVLGKDLAIDLFHGSANSIKLTPDIVDRVAQLGEERAPQEKAPSASSGAEMPHPKALPTIISAKEVSSRQWLDQELDRIHGELERLRASEGAQAAV